jgi:prophage regulatory protein
MSTQLLRLPAVLDRCAIGRSALYDMVAKGTFPKPIKVQKRSVAWLSQEVDAWVAACIAASRGAQP